MHLLFVTAELSPVARVGGLAEASAGLVRALRDRGVDVEVVVPDYSGAELAGETIEHLDLDSWAGSATVRRGHLESFGEVTLVEVAGIRRPHPYLEPESGMGWPDNDARFFRFSNAVAHLIERRRPDVVHLNDWHTAGALGMGTHRAPTVLTIHTIGYQGVTDASWRAMLPAAPGAFDWYDATNPLAGGIRLADRVIAVSPTYSREILTEQSGMGLDALLAARGDSLIGIRNGIDTAVWDPARDPHIASTFTVAETAGKLACRQALCDELGWASDTQPLVCMVTRLTEQKGIDLVLDALRFFDTMPARFAILGAGDRATANALREAQDARPDRIAFFEGYDDALGHRLFAGGDLFFMPSKFEPCGLAEMQAMAYGTIPVTTDVGGLHDTVLDDDRNRGRGNGFVSATVDAAGVVDALHRGVRAVRQASRRKALTRRAMSPDWSWTDPARAHIDLYESVLR